MNKDNKIEQIDNTKENLLIYLMNILMKIKYFQNNIIWR